MSFIVRSSDTGKFSLEWRLWAHGTSFYIAMRDPAMGIAKFSLHGPDPAIPGSPWWKFAETGVPKNAEEIATFYGASDFFPWQVSGRRVTTTVTNVLRFRYMNTIFNSPIAVPAPKAAVKKGRSACFNAPPAGDELWIDLYVAQPGTDPYFRDRDQTAEANAGIGPLVNDAGQSLTLVARAVTERPDRDPTEVTFNWDGDMTGYTGPVRVVNVNRDSTGLVWIVERDVPREVKIQLDADPEVRAYPEPTE